MPRWIFPPPVKSYFSVAGAMDQAVKESESENMLYQVGSDARCVSE